jgi:hypothetical protein
MEFLVFPEVLKLVEGEVEGGGMEEEHNAESSNSELSECASS